MDLGLNGRVAIVAAASKGLGKAVALGLSREGAKVAICARSAAELQAAADEMPGPVLARVADVRNENDVRALVDETVERFGKVDICVANAGGPPPKRFDETTAEDWEAAIELNFTSTLHFARAVLPGMKERRWGRFLAITSAAVKQPVDRLILSNSVRNAVSGLVKSLSNEYAPYNVLVNSVCPGYIATDRLKSLGVQPEGQIPLGRVGTPEEFANVVVFLASERASYVTGVAVAIDGGLIKGVY
jgi:3-oxoacyl-[acyl-carrier protein] reductase